MLTFMHVNEAAAMDEKAWHDLVKGMLKAELKRRNVTYEQLAAKLGELGIRENAQNIRTKISRGGFSAVFFVQCLRAIGCREARIDL
jgi:3-mercaptopyruvate sulfurtransferase SseA